MSVSSKIDVYYKGQIVGDYQADIIVVDQLLIEIKTVKMHRAGTYRANTQLYASNTYPNRSYRKLRHNSKVRYCFDRPQTNNMTFVDG